MRCSCYYWYWFEGIFRVCLSFLFLLLDCQTCFYFLKDRFFFGYRNCRERSLFVGIIHSISRTLSFLFFKNSERFQIEIVFFFWEERRRIMMERFLLAVENQGPGGESLLGSIKIAVLPIVKVFTMCFLGLLMASKYVNILPASGRKLLNGVCYVCMWNYYTLSSFSLTSCWFWISAGVYTVVTLLDILSAGTSCYFAEDAWLVSG